MGELCLRDWVSYSMVRQVQTQTSKDEIAEFLKEVTETHSVRV